MRVAAATASSENGIVGRHRAPASMSAATPTAERQSHPVWRPREVDDALPGHGGDLFAVGGLDAECGGHLLQDDHSARYRR